MTRLKPFASIVAVPVLAVISLAVVAPSTIRSPRALVTILAVTAVAMIGGRLLGRRFGPAPAWGWRAVVLGLAGWLLVAPAFRQTTLDEPLVSTALTAAAPSSRVAPSPTTSTPTTTTTSTTTTTPTPSTTVPDTAGPTTTTTVQDTPAPASSSQEPVLATTGELDGIGHHATGGVDVYRLADGSHIVRFDDVDIRNSPDPVLYLVPGSDKQTRGGGTRVENLKATKGSFNHAVPAGFDVTQEFTVFIWCDRFAVPIANATQSPAT